MRAESRSLLLRAAASCCWRLVMRVRVSLSDFLSLERRLLASAFWLVRLLMDWRLAVMLRLQGVRSTLPLLKALYAICRLFKMSLSLFWSEGMPKLVIEREQLAIWAFRLAIWVSVVDKMPCSWLSWLVLMTMKVEILPRRSLRYWVLATQLRELITTFWTVCLMATMSPALMRVSSSVEVGNLTFDPVPEFWRGITPAVEVVLPTPRPEPELELLELEVEVEEEEDPYPTIAELVGMEVTAPVELKVKVWSQGQSPMRGSPPLETLTTRLLNSLFPRASVMMSLMAQVPPGFVQMRGMLMLLPDGSQVEGQAWKLQVKGEKPPVTGTLREQQPPDT